MTQIDSSRALVSRLKSALFKKRLLLFISGILATASVVIVTSIILSLVALVVVLPVAVKISLLILSGLATLYVFGKYSFKHFFTGDIE